MKNQQPVKQITLDADLYDALELSALAFGGIGYGAYNDYVDNSMEVVAPRCIIGHSRSIRDNNGTQFGETTQLLYIAGIDEAENDKLVERALRAGKGIKDANGKSTRRITWAEYVKRANIVRAEEPATV